VGGKRYQYHKDQNNDIKPENRGIDGIEMVEKTVMGNPERCENQKRDEKTEELRGHGGKIEGSSTAASDFGIAGIVRLTTRSVIANANTPSTRASSRCFEIKLFPWVSCSSIFTLLTKEDSRIFYLFSFDSAPASDCSG